jgi:hypothetical protein
VVALYTNRHDKPSKRIATGSRMRPRRGRWNEVAIKPTAVHRGRTYWIALLAVGGRLDLRDRVGGCRSVNSRGRHLSSLPVVWIGSRRRPGCRVTAYVRGVLRATQTPNPPPPSGNLAPASVGEPLITGTVASGARLSTTTGSWTNAPTSYQYAWRDCGLDGSACSIIPGANAST